MNGIHGVCCGGNKHVSMSRVGRGPDLVWVPDHETTVSCAHAGCMLVRKPPVSVSKRIGHSQTSQRLPLRGQHKELRQAGQRWRCAP